LITFVSYVEHFGGNHKLIRQFMNLEILAKYLRLAAKRSKTSKTKSDKKFKQELENSNSTPSSQSSVESLEKSSVIDEKAASQELISPESINLNQKSSGHKSEQVVIKAEMSLTFENDETFLSQYETTLFETESEEIRTDVEDPVLNEIALDVDQLLRQDLSNEHPKSNEISNISSITEERFDISNMQAQRNESKTLKTLKRRQIVGQKRQTLNKNYKIISTEKTDSTRSANGKTIKPKTSRVTRSAKISNPNWPMTGRPRRAQEIRKEETANVSKRKSINKPQREKTQQKYNCPECQFSFDHVSSIYTHSAVKHYHSELSKLHRENFMLTENKFCFQCPDRNLNDVGRYVLHIGGKHKVIHQFLPPNLIEQYDLLPDKKMNSAYNQSKLQKSLKCLICTSSKSYENVTEYKQHLSHCHFRDQISSYCKKSNPVHWRKMTCFICAQTEKRTQKPFAQSSGLISHLVSLLNVSIPIFLS
jgi:hypothetical protein